MIASNIWSWFQSMEFYRSIEELEGNYSVNPWINKSSTSTKRTDFLFIGTDSWTFIIWM